MTTIEAKHKRLLELKTSFIRFTSEQDRRNEEVKRLDDQIKVLLPLSLCDCTSKCTSHGRIRCNDDYCRRFQNCKHYVAENKIRVLKDELGMAIQRCTQSMYFFAEPLAELQLLEREASAPPMKDQKDEKDVPPPKQNMPTPSAPSL